MTNKPTSEDAQDPATRGHDDFTAIRGVTKPTQDWLIDSFGVRTFSDLAKLSAGEIESRAKKAKRTGMSRSKIENWLAQAGRLAVASSSTPKTGRKAEVIDTEEVNSRKGQSKWKTLAQFVVVFEECEVSGGKEQKTTVGQTENGGANATFDGLDRERLGQWMWDRLGVEVHTVVPEAEAEVAQRVTEAETHSEEAQKPLDEPGESSVEPRKSVVEASPPPIDAPPSAPSPAALEIPEIQLIQPPKTGVTCRLGPDGKMPTYFVTADEPFTIKASLELSGSGAAEATKKRMNYSVKFYAHNRSTTERVNLGETTPTATAEGQMSYTASLSGAKLLSGIYELRVVATLQGGRARAGYLEVPLLQVM